MNSISFLPIPLARPSLVVGLPVFTVQCHGHLGVRPFTHTPTPTLIKTREKTKICAAASYWSRDHGHRKMLLNDAVEKTRKYHSAVFAKELLDVSKRKLGAEAEKDPLWTLLVHESELVDKLKLEREISVMNYVSREESLPKSEEELRSLLNVTMKYLENGFAPKYSNVNEEWVANYGLKLFDQESMWVDLILKKIKYHSSLIAMMKVKDASEEEFEPEPLWKDLVAESELLNKSKSDLYEAELRYFRCRPQQRTSKYDFKEKLYWLVSNSESCVPRFSVSVSMWLKKYGTPESNDHDADIAWASSSEISGSAEAEALAARLNSDNRKNLGKPSQG